MKARHIFIFVILVLLPLGTALVLGVRSLSISAGERELRAAALLDSRLDDLVKRADALRSDWEHTFGALARSSGLDDVSLQDLSAHEPRVRQAFLVDAKGQLQYPKVNGASLKENEFLTRTASFLAAGWLPAKPERGDWPETGGWYRWYWQDGLQWVFWVPRQGQILGLDLNRSALLADLAAKLEGPTIPAAKAPFNRVQVRDERGRVFLQWGSWQPDGDKPLARKSLSGPLEGWQLSWDVDKAHWLAEGDGAPLAIIFSLVALSLAAVFLAFFFLREYRRELREAGQKVSFVNQVSHELKTPLTNIRLYAELLESRLLPEQTREREYAAIIEREGRRLGRLIHNVLTFGRKDKNDEIKPQPGVPDECLRLCLESFAVWFAEKELAVELDLACPKLRRFDPDSLDQMIGNLLSNAEKYAASGGKIRIESREQGEFISVSVRDWGPGIPDEGVKRLFKPFERFHTELTAAVGGTGLGLHLVQELARRHGGDVAWEDARPGARFTITLHAPHMGEPA